MLLIVLPIVCLWCVFRYGKRQKVKWQRSWERDLPVRSCSFLQLTQEERSSLSSLSEIEMAQIQNTENRNGTNTWCHLCPRKSWIWIFSKFQIKSKNGENLNWPSRWILPVPLTDSSPDCSYLTSLWRFCQALCLDSRKGRVLKRIL